MATKALSLFYKKNNKTVELENDGLKLLSD